MLNDLASESPRGVRNYLILTSVLAVLAAIYIGWVFYSRRQSNQAIEEKAAEQRQRRDRQTFEGMGGTRFAILAFYANPASIFAGETADLCYGVSNAKLVKLEPQSHTIWPAFSHCVQVTPRKNTTYTFTAEDGAGHTKVATVEVEVKVH
jgi:hypothetical protein